MMSSLHFKVEDLHSHNCFEVTYESFVYRAMGSFPNQVGWGEVVSSFGKIHI
uniref:Uncharacterized protein n=1 Tax=Arundo donax TaxID=35708 RepID=A0A0A9CDE1_ARUDO